jgi:hypothetical protein
MSGSDDLAAQQCKQPISQRQQPQPEGTMERHGTGGKKTEEPQ